MNAAIRTPPSEHAAKRFIAPKLFTAKRLSTGQSRLTARSDLCGLRLFSLSNSTAKPI